ncbi:DUF1642 domain-containing protein [Listeria innocua]|uniref:DUF1642 domain-containing protein n=1 Tax=Listeria innocua TaxID=1642 RepID=UPI0016253A42|nr:DUF1642 domain-containing protein [Listeria innocua]MBC2143688.1 DUF1642 domain-containing protein [Listeria innocua]
MKFSEGDKVEFIYLGELKQGVVTEIRASNFDISYQVKVEFMGTLWVTERDLVAPAPVLKVPQFVADYIEDAKKGVYNTLADAFNCHTKNWDVASWLQNFDDLDGLDYDKAYKNQELFARAWLDGYEVEKEPLYYVRLPLSTWNDDAAELEVINMYVLLNIQSDETTFTGSIINKNKKWKTKLTEAEIKGMPGGDIYWQFAVPVEELGVG